MLPNWVRLLVEYTGAIAFGAVVFVLIQWVTISFTITGNGEVKWAEGWEATKNFWIED